MPWRSGQQQLRPAFGQTFTAARIERPDGDADMIALTLYVCLHSFPNNCRPENVFFDGSLFSCSLYGQAIAADWIATHPKYRLQKYTCGLRPLPEA